MSGRRFTRWQLYEQVEPFGERAAYWRAGQICATFANIQCRTKKTDEVLTAEDFMPATFRDEDPEPPEGPSEYQRMKALSERRTR